ncbi:FHA domain-containing protein [Kitasatospora sp. NPDC096147]|uniref:FHA domain-containing protein n=1 Tax=Kitasatospora sp. NPDC096147 TaxID=3364093 RepID=UPI00381431C4
MASIESRTALVRPSENERDRALHVLREGVGAGRLSHDTFIRRMELVLAARTRAELADATGDLDTRDPVSRFLLRTVAKVSALRVGLRRSWYDEQLPGLGLPGPGVTVLRIGRMTGSGLRLGDATVSRHHAELRREGDGWVLYDLGSSNGTFVNELRVAGAVVVRAGDRVRFGSLAFQLTAV